mgnify:CR=1 FL=1
MFRPVCWVSCMATLMLMACGCDQAPAPPEDISSAAGSKERDPRPTTQQFVDLPRQRIRLDGYPLSIEVPETWKMQRLGPIDILQGPIPSGHLLTGDVQIQVSRMPAVLASQIDILAEDARQLAQRQPNRYKHVEVRKDGALHIIDKRWIEPARSATNPEGRPVEIPELVGWELTIYVPRHGNFVPYRLKFVLLTAEQYARDGKLLEPILSSVRYEPSLETIDISGPK